MLFVGIDNKKTLIEAGSTSYQAKSRFCLAVTYTDSKTLRFTRLFFIWGVEIMTSQKPAEALVLLDNQKSPSI